MVAGGPERWGVGYLNRRPSVDPPFIQSKSCLHPRPLPTASAVASPAVGLLSNNHLTCEEPCLHSSHLCRVELRVRVERQHDSCGEA